MTPGKEHHRMRKILMGLIITGFALVLFITIKPQMASLVVNPETPLVAFSDGQIALEPAPYFSVVQGGSELALYVKNNMADLASFSLGHEHAYLTFRPQGDRLASRSSREVFLYVDPECPVGEIELPVYLRAEVNGERIGKDMIIIFNVIPGELSLEYDQYGLKVLWNGEPAPRGVSVYYRPPGNNEWQIWGETPRVGTPDYLGPGDYEFEFKAELGDAVSEIEKFTFTVKEIVVAEEPEPDSAANEGNTSASTAEPEPVPEPEPPKEPPKPGTREYLVMIHKKMQVPDKNTEEKEEEPKQWFE